MTNPPITQQKRELRERFLEVRSHVSEKEAASTAQTLITLFDKHFHTLPASIAGYVPVGSEVNILPLLHHLAAKDVSIALPCIEQKNAPLLFRQWQPGTSLVRNRFYHVQEPHSSAPLITPAMILVPLVAFDSNGVRLGFGGGYYDRTLAALRQTPTQPIALGIAYECQRAETIPHTSLDERLELILTPERLYTCTASAA